MVRRIVTKLAVVKKRGRKRGAIYRSPRIYLPTKLTDDSCFPFLDGEQVAVEVSGDRLVVSGLRRSAKRRRRRR